jgi:excisionase family DNA binding protein
MNAEGSERDGAEIEVEPRFFTLEQTARYLNVSKPQVYALVRSGELPAIKLGGRGVWRVDRQQLETYIERLTRETAEWAKAHPLGRESDAQMTKTTPDEPS